VVRPWRGNWDNIIPFFQFVPEIRKVIYTTNAIESLNMSMRKLTRNRRIFPNDESALKSLFLAIQEAAKGWESIHHWKPALQSFQLMFGEDESPPRRAVIKPQRHSSIYSLIFSRQDGSRQSFSPFRFFLTPLSDVDPGHLEIEHQKAISSFSLQSISPGP
jgi:hypothetical protein